MAALKPLVQLLLTYLLILSVFAAAPNTPTVKEPGNESTVFGESAELKVNVSDPDGQDMNITFYNLTDSRKWWNRDWSYRKQIDIEEKSDFDLTDYQVLVNDPFFNETGLVGSYHMNTGSGNELNDTSPNSNNGSITGASWTSAKFNDGLSFDGSNDFVNLSEGDGDFDFGTGGFTVSMWVKTSDTDHQAFISKRSTCGAVPFFDLRSQGSDSEAGELKFALHSGSTANRVGGTTNLSDNNWHHITVGRNSSSLFLYVDGELDNSTSSGDLDISNNANLGLGTSPCDSTGFGDTTDDGTQPFDGSMDEVRIYNRSLNRTEIQKLNDSKMKPDYRDVRFVNTSDQVKLDYWMEHDGKFWVKVPSIAASTTKRIKMYYGNTGTSSLSDPEDTLYIYDLFGNGIDGTLKGDANHQTSKPEFVELTDTTDNQEGSLRYSSGTPSPGFHAEWEWYTGDGDGADSNNLIAWNDGTNFEDEDPDQHGIAYSFNDHEGAQGVNWQGQTGDIEGTSVGTATAKWETATAYGIRNDTNFTYFFDSSLGVTIGEGKWNNSAFPPGDKFGWSSRTGGLNNHHWVRKLEVRKFTKPQPSVNVGDEVKESSTGRRNAEKIKTDKNVASGDDASIPWEDLRYGNTYRWKAEACDTADECTNTSFFQFTTETFTAAEDVENVSLKLEGLSGNFYTENGEKLSSGESKTSAELPYIAAVDSGILKGVVSYEDFIKLSRPSSDEIKVVQDQGTFLLPFTKPNYTVIEDHRDDINNNRFLDLLKASFNYKIPDTPSVRAIFQPDINASGFNSTLYNDMRLLVRNTGSGDVKIREQYLE